MRKGLEMEFSYRPPVFTPGSQPSFLAREEEKLLSDIGWGIFLPLAEKFGFRTASKDIRIWLYSGDCFYIESMGKHPEFATAECDRLKDLIAHSEAGVKFVAGLAKETNRKLHESEKGALAKPLILFRANRDSKDNISSEQENYEITYDLWTELVNSCPGTKTKILITFILVTMPLWGAGNISQDGENAIRFEFSQRIQKVTLPKRVFSSSDIVGPFLKKSVELIGPRSPHPDSKARAQISRDATPSQYATFLKLGTMGLLLRALESNFLELPWFDLPWVGDDRPTYANLIGSASQDVSLKNIYPIQGQELPLTEINRSFLSQLKIFYSDQELSEEEIMVFKIWEETLGDLERFRAKPERVQDFPRLARRLDWAIKRKIIERALEKWGYAWEDILGPGLDLKSEDRARLFARLFALSSQYHNIDPEVKIPGVENLELERDHLVSPEEIIFASQNPPFTTAQKRCIFLRALKERQEGKHPLKEVKIDWDLVWLNCEDSKNKYDTRSIILDGGSTDLTEEEKDFLSLITHPR